MANNDFRPGPNMEGAKTFIDNVEKYVQEASLDIDYDKFGIIFDASKLHAMVSIVKDEDVTWASISDGVVRPVTKHNIIARASHEENLVLNEALNEIQNKILAIKIQSKDEGKIIDTNIKTVSEAPELNEQQETIEHEYLEESIEQNKQMDKKTLDETLVEHQFEKDEEIDVLSSHEYNIDNSNR